MSERLFNQLKAEGAASKAPKPELEAQQPDNDDLVQLQRMIGNQGVQRLIAQRKLADSGSGMRIQPKLDVGPADDPYEREADQVAKQVVSQPETAQRQEEELQMKRADIQRDEGAEMEEEELQMKRADIQRDEGAEMEEEELQMKRADIQREGGMEEEELQMKRADIQRKGTEAGFEVDGSIEDEIQSQRGSGQTMGNDERGFFEERLGHDFSGVQVHNDAQSDVLNRSLDARAFTIGSDVFFREGEYQPDSDSGKELIAHELTHVVQQGAAVQKKDKEE